LESGIAPATLLNESEEMLNTMIAVAQWRHKQPNKRM